MLVLSRKVGEKIVLDNNIVVTVLGFKGGRVRLGIDAPPEVHVVRAELDQAGETARSVAHQERACAGTY